MLKEINTLRALFDELPIAVFLKDRNSHIYFMNKACEAQWGVSFASIRGTDGSQFFPPDQIEKFNAKDKEIFQNRCQQEFEEPIWNASLHENRIGHTFKKPIYDDFGNPLYLIGITIDVTENAKLHQKLLSSEEKLRSMFEMSPLGMARNAMDGTFVEANAAFLKIVGYSLNELNQMNYWVLTPEKYADQELQQLESLKNTRRYGPYEKEYINNLGESIQVRLNGVQVSGSDGKQYIWSIIEDVTESKRVESLLRIAAIAFEAQVGILITDANQAILKVNRTFLEQTGYLEEELLGKTPKLLSSGRHDRSFYEFMWSSINQTGSWNGEIWDRRKNGEIYPKLMTISAIKDESNKVTHYVGTQIDVSDRKAAENEIHHLAFYDPLTDLPNRRLMLDRLHHTMLTSERTRNSGAVLFIDIDHFKVINETMSHVAGDVMLQRVAERLVACVREGDTVARFGGDEFVVVLSDLNNEVFEAATQTESIGRKILNAINEPYQIDAQEFNISCSIGATLFIDHEESKDEVIKQAEIAMQQAKNTGRNNLCFFNSEMQNSINNRVVLERELREGVRNQEFQLYYQVQVDSAYRPTGAEALIRWKHPSRGLVAPNDFIPLAEETGLIVLIGQWVLETACLQLKAWENNVLTSHLILSINISAKQFHQEDFVQKVADALARYGVKPNLLKLELTESMLLDNIESIIAKMNKLKSMGIRFSLDDFGTGYSSLQYLKKLPIQQLKIDQSFVRDIAIDPSDEAIVTTIIGMSKTLKFNVIAEGVETEAQKQLLIQNGCTHFQGYLFGKPVPVELLEAQLVEFNNNLTKSLS
jgi:diguanylate cyclase (GGDEF)-like protein/PAS domain S-box-containing protein